MIFWTWISGLLCAKIRYMRVCYIDCKLASGESQPCVYEHVCGDDHGFSNVHVFMITLMLMGMVIILMIDMVMSMSINGKEADLKKVQIFLLAR